MFLRVQINFESSVLLGWFLFPKGNGCVLVVGLLKGSFSQSNITESFLWVFRCCKCSVVNYAGSGAVVSKGANSFVPAVASVCYVGLVGVGYFMVLFINDSFVHARITDFDGVLPVFLLYLCLAGKCLAIRGFSFER